jgi:hypothetical protein
MSLLSRLTNPEIRIDDPSLWTNTIRRRPRFVVIFAYVLGFLVLLFYVCVLLVLLWHFGNDIFVYDTTKIDKSIVYLGSILAVPAALWAVFVAVQQIFISRENHFTALFSSSIEQLGTRPVPDSVAQAPQLRNFSFDIRIAGIYGLERVARDSSRDHWPIMEILCRYVRQNHCAKKVEQIVDSANLIAQLKSLPEPPFDLEAAMMAIGRRSWRKVVLERELRNRLQREVRERRSAVSKLQSEEDESAFNEIDESFCLNFDGSNLCKLKLWNCDFSHGLFRNCDMRGIVFWVCDLSDAKFSDSALSGAIFYDCCLDRASFQNNDLSHAQLSRVTLRDTRFYVGVNVSSTSIFNTNLDQVDKEHRPKWNEDWVFNF